MTSTRITGPPPYRVPTIRKLLALVAACGLLAAACSSSGDAEPDISEAGGSETTTPSTDSSSSTEDPGASPTEPGETPAELGRGVTDDTITLGYLHLDLDDVREQGIIDLNWGPMADHAQTIVDHINANGGINGRSIELIVRAIDPVDPASAQTACLELTEDTEVFAVLGTVRRDEVLCYTEQHETIAIVNADMTQERIDRAAAPYVSVNVARERSSQAFVAEAMAQGLFDDATVAVVSVDATGTAADVVIPALQAAGVDVELEVLIQGDGSVSGAAAELTANVESMRQRNIDTVIVVGDTTVPVNTFIGEGYFPTIFFTDQGAANAVAGRADLSLFPAAYNYGGPSAGTEEAFQETRFQEECVAPWDAANPDLAAEIPTAVPAGEPSHGTGLRLACRTLTVFAEIAEAAGPNLNNDTFGAALEGLGEFTLAGTGPASLGNGKFDALDDLRLWIHNPDAADDEPEFKEFGS